MPAISCSTMIWSPPSGHFLGRRRVTHVRFTNGSPWVAHYWNPDHRRHTCQPPTAVRCLGRHSVATFRVADCHTGTVYKRSHTRGPPLEFRYPEVRMSATIGCTMTGPPLSGQFSECQDRCKCAGLHVSSTIGLPNSGKPPVYRHRLPEFGLPLSGHFSACYLGCQSS